MIVRKNCPNLEAKRENITVLLEGVLSADIGSDPTVILSVLQNGTAWPSNNSSLCDGLISEVRQHGVLSCPPQEGRVEMSWTTWVPSMWTKTGFYEFRAEMYTTNGTLMTDLKWTTWFEAQDRVGFAKDQISNEQT
jgi:hypothetical protein